MIRDAAAPVHQVRAVQLRAQIVQRELATKYDRDYWLPYIWEAMDNLPATITQHVAGSRFAEAEYWLIQAELFAGVTTREQFQGLYDRLVIGAGDLSFPSDE